MGPRLPLPVVVLRGLVLVLTAIFMLSHLPLLSGRLPLWAVAVLTNGVYAAATLLVVVRAVTVKVHRFAWAMIAAGLCFYTAGTVYSWVMTWDGGVLPYPSPSDLAWLLFYPVAYCGILGFSGSLRLPPRLMLDGAIAGLGGAAIFSVLVQDLALGSATCTAWRSG